MINSINPNCEIHFRDTVATSAGGRLFIRGYVKKIGIGIPCRVRLLEKMTGILIAEKVTDTFGFYEFTNLKQTIFVLIAHDPENKFNAVIQDNVVPK